MRAGLSAAAIAASVVLTGTSWATCPPGKSRSCVNLDLAPEISQQIVAGEGVEARRVTAPAAEPASTYTGPTLGIAPTVHRTPVVGYRWSIN